MCILLQLNYAKFGVSNLFFSKVMEEKSFGVGSTPPPGTGRVKIVVQISDEISVLMIAGLGFKWNPLWQ